MVNKPESPDYDLFDEFVLEQEQNQPQVDIFRANHQADVYNIAAALQAESVQSAINTAVQRAQEAQAQEFEEQIQSERDTFNAERDTFNAERASFNDTLSILRDEIQKLAEEIKARDADDSKNE